MVYLCNSIAAASPQVSVDVIDADVFPDVAATHHAGTVPLVVINGATTVVDVVPAADLIARIAST